MKTKSFILTAISAVLLSGAFSSCEDMLTTESTVVMFDNENQLDQATDTVYSVMGIFSKLQAIADRTVLFGELRGELVNLTDEASADLREIMDFQVSSDNKYNNVIDYYAVINNCNYFLTHADTAYKRNGKSVFLKEWVAVKSLRAWTYLQLAQAYGRVPFVTTPITSSDAANPSDYPFMDIKQIANELLSDMDADSTFLVLNFPEYGTIGETFKAEKMFIPVRLILGDLCLWGANGQQEMYRRAAKYYHDYLFTTSAQYTTGIEQVNWNTTDWVAASDNYSIRFTVDNNKNSEQITYIPMESEEYEGIVSELPELFNSTDKNKNYFKISYSARAVELSAEQQYVYYEKDRNTFLDVIKYLDPIEQNDKLLQGDLRLNSVVSTKVLTDKNMLVSYGKNQQTVNKIQSDRVVLYRKDLVYLRYAEALNRAGFPTAAFAILKYGLADNTMPAWVDAAEIADAASDGILEFPNSYFQVLDYVLSSGKVTSTGNTIGIHSHGSGMARFNDFYCYPTQVAHRNPVEYVVIDSVTVNPEYAELTDPVEKKNWEIKKVEELIADEMALELAFEGYRFGDLMRISMHRGEAEGKWADNAYLASKVAARAGVSQKDSELESKLTGDGSSYNPAWFLSMPN